MTIEEMKPWQAAVATLAAGKARRQAFRDYALDGALLRFHPDSGTQIRIANADTWHLRRVVPRVAMFGITNKCNLSCDFCSRDVQRESAWTVASAAQVLRELSQAGVLEVAFGGGEPFAFRGFADLVDELYETTALALNVTSNGLLIRQRSFARYASRLGQVRLSLYEDPRWRDAAQILSGHGQKWGANLLVDTEALGTLPQLLAALAALGCHDVSLLSYIGPDLRRHLRPEDKLQLAAIVQDAPLACRLSVCFGDTVPVPRLFDGADGSGDCGAGVDFVSITPDQRMQGCSFHDGGLPARHAQEILDGWRQRRARLAQPSLRHGCAGRKRGGALQTQDAEVESSVRVWQAFSGNNSGECVMVARFDTVADAEDYLAQLLPDWKPEQEYASQWQQLFKAQAVAGPGLQHGEMPRELLAMGRSVIAVGYAAEDMFPELRALAWKQGATVMPGGIHCHMVSLLAVMRAASAEEAQKLEASRPAALKGASRIFLHGDMLMLVFALDGQEDELAGIKQLLETYAAGRPLAAELVSSSIDDADMVAVMKRLGVAIAQEPRLMLQFWRAKEGEAEEKAAQFAKQVTEASVTVAGAMLLISGLSRRKRLAVLGNRQGAVVQTLDSAELQISARLMLPLPPRQKGVRAETPSIDIAALREDLQQRLRWGAQTPETLTVEAAYRGSAYVRVSSTRPEFVLTQLEQAAHRLGARAYFGVGETDELAQAVRRLMADVREVRI